MSCRRWRCTCLLVLMMPLAAFALTPAQDAERRQQTNAWQNQVAQQLADKNTADALTSAARLLPVPDTYYSDGNVDGIPLECG